MSSSTSTSRRARRRVRGGDPGAQITPSTEPSANGSAAPGSQDDRPTPVLRALRAGVAVAGGAMMLTYVAVALLRIRSPFELEWIEGGVVDDVRQILAGQQLYRRPSIEFIPYIYTPLYYYVAAGAAKVFGTGFFALRLVSFVASFGAFAAIAWLVIKETGDRWAGWLSACLFAACFRLGGAWFDLARVDSLFVALLLAGLAVARFARSAPAVVLAGVVITLSFLTKQAALLPAVAVVPFLWRRNPRHAALYAAVVSAGVGGSTLVLNQVSSGWYSTYVFQLPAGHEVVEQEYVHFWTTDMAPLVLAVVVSVAGLVVTARRRRTTRPSPLWFYLPVGVGLVAAAYTSRLHSGGYDNVLFPAHAAVAIGFGLGLHALTRPSIPAPGTSARAARRRWVPAVACVAALVQFGVLVYNPADQVPSPAQGRRARHLVAALRDLPGSVFLPGHGWYLSLAGKPTSAQGAAISDILRGKAASARRDLNRELRRAVAEQRFDAIVVDSIPRYSYLPSNLRRYYRPDHRLFQRDALLLPQTGTLTGPLTVWVPRSSSEEDGLAAPTRRTR